MKKLKNIKYKSYTLLFIALIIGLWHGLSSSGLVASYMLPSPPAVLKALINDWPLLMMHLKVTLTEAVLGLLCGMLAGLGCALIMSQSKALYHGLYPILVLTQTVPTVAIAPLLVLWLGYDMAPKVVLIVIVTFFPIAVNVLDGLRSADPDQIALLRAMGANEWFLLRYVRWPAALGGFFASMKIAVSYAVVGAVIAEWLGGFEGLGVYMTRVKSAYAFDKMFAVILIISLLSLLLMAAVHMAERFFAPWLADARERGTRHEK